MTVTMQQLKLTDEQVKKLYKAAKIIATQLSWYRTKEGHHYWLAVHDSLLSMADNKTYDGQPREDEPQSVDSSKPNFEMPEDWHGREVYEFDESGQVRINTTFKLIGWDDKPASLPSGFSRYIAVGEDGNLRRLRNILFTEQPEPMLWEASN